MWFPAAYNVCCLVPGPFLVREGTVIFSEIICFLTNTGDSLQTPSFRPTVSNLHLRMSYPTLFSPNKSGGYEGSKAPKLVKKLSNAMKIIDWHWFLATTTNGRFVRRLKASVCCANSFSWFQSRGMKRFLCPSKPSKRVKLRQWRRKFSATVRHCCGCCWGLFTSSMPFFGYINFGQHHSDFPLKYLQSVSYLQHFIDRKLEIYPLRIGAAIGATLGE